MKKIIKNKVINIVLLLTTIITFFIILEVILRYTALIDTNQFNENNLYWEMNKIYFSLDNNQRKTIGLKNLNKVDINNTIIYIHPDFKEQTCKKLKGDHFRIIIIGDSIIEGAGASKPENRISNQLYLKLNNISTYTKYELLKNVTDDFRYGYNLHNKYETLNFAIGGYNIVQTSGLFNEQVIPCNPDLVIFGVYQNDFETGNWQILRGLYIKEILKKIPLKKYLFKSKTVHFLIQSIISITEKINPEISPYYDKNKYNPSQQIDDVMHFIIKGVREREIPFYIIEFPRFDENDSKMNTFLINLVKSEKIDYLNIKEEINNRKIAYISIDANDGSHSHYNDYGQQIIADIIYEDILKKGLVK